MYVGEVGNKFAHLVREAAVFDHVEFIRAGKLRRYPNEKKIKQLLDVKTHLLNIRDAGYSSVGLVQARKLISKYKPDSIFIKGGFVSVPMGVAAAQKKVPYVIHDSDTVPGLANRLIAKNAVYHLTGMPESFYDDAKDKLRFTGTPLSEQYERISTKQQQGFKKEINIAVDAPMLLVTGGSQGAKRLNQIVANSAEKLLIANPKLVIVHQIGKQDTDDLYDHLNQTLRGRVVTHEYINDMHKYSGAADVIVTRAGATTMSELAVQAKPCILVPSPYLAGGHQLKNAGYFADHNAALVIDEAKALRDSGVLVDATKIALDPVKGRELADNLHKLAKPNAAYDIAWTVLNIGAKT